MRIRSPSSQPCRANGHIAALIAVVLSLLIFFLMTLPISQPEGQFNFRMSSDRRGFSPPRKVILPDIKVRLQSSPDGSLRMLSLGQRQLGNDRAAFQRLNSEILAIIGKPGNPLTKDIEAEIDADYNLDFQYVISAVSACTGRLGKQGQIVRYVEKIKFTPPKRPGGGA